MLPFLKLLLLSLLLTSAKMKSEGIGGIGTGWLPTHKMKSIVTSYYIRLDVSVCDS